MNDGAPPRVDHFRFGRVIVDGQVYVRDLVIFPEGVQEEWQRGESHLLAADDLDLVLGKTLQTLIIGTGVFRSMKVPAEACSRVEAAGIEVLVLDSRQACEEYNRRRLQERAALAMHLTC